MLDQMIKICLTYQKPQNYFLKWFKYFRNLILKPKTIQFPKENMGENLYNFRLGKDFLDRRGRAPIIKKL